jgi:hypothetical protein
MLHAIGLAFAAGTARLGEVWKASQEIRGDCKRVQLLT